MKVWPYIPLLCFGVSLAIVVNAYADHDPGPPAETVTVTTTVAELVNGRDVHRATQLLERADKDRRAAARVIRKLRAANRDRVRLGAHGLERAFLCIKRFEGGWRSRDLATGQTYFGGLQMDRAFMRAYGDPFYAAWGTADRWPPAVQLAVAMRAYLSGRGFSPWPNTRRMCGL